MAGKAVTIQIPFIFKHLVDASTTMDPSAQLPLALLLGYGCSRAAAAALQEYRNVVFAVVAQDAIRKMGVSIFEHIHTLDLHFHTSRNTGQLSRTLDRGQRSISFILNSMVFHVGPTLLEVSLVTGLFAYQFGTAHSAVVLATVGAYCGFTFGITSWRTQFRREMNRLDNQASGRVVDSLLNFETVQYFNNTKYETDRYNESLKGYQAASLESQRSLSLLNFGQAAIFSVGLTAIMGLTSSQIAAGTATVGDLVLVNGLLFQLSVPLFFIGSVYREVRQSIIDMEAMFKLKDTMPAVTDRNDAVPFDPASSGTTIRLKDVYFGYLQERSILNGASLEIPQGQTVAIVGSSGCGKVSSDLLLTICMGSKAC